MQLPYSSRAQRLRESATIRMARLAHELRAQGHRVIDLSLGEPDFTTPEHIAHAAYEGARQGYTHYPPVPGYPDLREAIVEDLQKSQVKRTADSVVVSTGAKQVLFNLFSAILDSGSGVAVPVPYWVSYADMIEFVGGRVVPIPPDTNFKINPDKLAEALQQPDVRIFLFNSPSNPAGVLYSREEIAALVEVLRRFPDVWIISDEVYDRIIHDGQFVSIASFPEVQERVIVVNSCSKRYAMTGWRLGWMVAPSAHLAQICAKIQGQVTSGANSLAQRAAIEALLGPQDAFQKMYATFTERRNIVLQLLQEAQPGGLKWVVPQGAFYLWLDIHQLIESAPEQIPDGNAFAEYLLRNYHVAAVGGNAFGLPSGIRLSLAAATDDLVEGIRRIIDAAKALGQ